MAGGRSGAAGPWWPGPARRCRSWCTDSMTTTRRSRRPHLEASTRSWSESSVPDRRRTASSGSRGPRGTERRPPGTAPTSSSTGRARSRYRGEEPEGGARGEEPGRGGARGRSQGRSQWRR
ncbi:hypothetical protein EYF80_065761 [Liparis tanakae]|uniref:Uncharacterized protein n=1 Tax=Liparis tanakae TaxID=230148 RepID=A0A4Z2E5B9_9TELE|nr:hypothetical protein EYF80_065761 [Liparis tanakae]